MRERLTVDEWFDFEKVAERTLRHGEPIALSKAELDAIHPDGTHRIRDRRALFLMGRPIVEILDWPAWLGARCTN